MRFMRGKYCLDEVGDGKDELKFKKGKKTVLTVYIREDKYTFLIIFGKWERLSFEKQRDTFSQYILDYYDNSTTYHDGKWMFIDVSTLEQLEEVKKLIQIKKKPNRYPFLSENAVYGKCGHRCDLCLHYNKMSEEQRAGIEKHLNNVWGVGDWSMRCGGCESDECYCKDATVADGRSRIHTDSYSADDITWGILPFVPGQYEDGAKTVTDYQKQRKSKPSVEETVEKYLQGTAKERALRFVSFLRENKMAPQWGAVNSYNVSCKNRRVCILKINESGFQIRVNTQYNDDFNAFFSEESDETKEYLRASVSHCFGCGGCKPGLDIEILGKRFADACCNPSIHISDPDDEMLALAEKLVLLRKQAIKDGKAPEIKYIAIKNR